MCMGVSDTLYMVLCECMRDLSDPYNRIVFTYMLRIQKLTIMIRSGVTYGVLAVTLVVSYIGFLNSQLS